MKALAVLIAAILSPALWALGYPGAHISHEEFADLGRVTILSPPPPARALVLLFDDGAELPREAYRLANAGYLVAHIPLSQFLAKAAANHDDCLDAVTLLDVFSQHLQQNFRFERYQRPLLVGRGAAAPFALATLAKAPNNLFRAGAGLGFQPEVALPSPPCAAPGLSAEAVGDGRYRIAAADMPTPWRALGSVRELDNFAAEFSAGASGELADLPLVELPLPPANAAVVPDPTLKDVFVILLSGDGGWANIDKDIGEQLNRAGLPVIGWNSLQYFWSEKTPEQAGADLARTIAHYQQQWQRPRVLLIGFSLGADVLTFMITRLPPPARGAIADTVFLGLGKQVDFQFHVTDWVGGDNDNGRPIPPELAKLAGQRMLCIYGKDDEDTICGSRPNGVDVVELPGDHHFDGDYERATQLILDHLRQQHL